ncbi:TetR/AcrR family transcriptional regulator [Phenylobacterium sp.]|uniref:TetR/AcrR family transcriptional regulator n=1 Tax=Phenylobacterium sp. TaxID=1871053 RepID=UPI0035B09C2E
MLAALEEFSGKGFDGASTREIAARAGVHHALIKYHFKSKDQLWRAATAYLFEREAELVDRPDPADPAFADPKTYARELLRRHVRYWAHHPEHTRVVLQESFRDSERLRWVVETQAQHWVRMGQTYTDYLKAHGLAPANLPTANMAYVLVGASQLFFAVAPQARLLWGVDPSEPETIEAHIDTLVAMLLP